MVYYEPKSSLQTTKILLLNEEALLLDKETRFSVYSRVDDRVWSKTKLSFYWVKQFYSRGWGIVLKSCELDKLLVLYP